MRIAICDDMPDQLALIKSAVKRYAADFLCESASISEFEHPLTLLEELESNQSYDIILLDICMPGITGIEAAKEIRATNSKVQIIFLTTSNEFAVEAFALKAAHYLVKPFTAKQFDEAMDRVMERLSSEKAKSVALKIRGGAVRVVEINDILSVESHLHTQNVFLKSGETLEVRQTMNELLSAFDNIAQGQFVVPHKGYIVNLKNIRSIEPDKIILPGNGVVPLARNSFRAIKDQYFNCTFEKGVSP